MRTKGFYELQRRWRRQIGARQRLGRFPRQRDAGPLGFLFDVGQSTGLVELSKVLLVVVYDEPRGRKPPVIRVGGYCASRCAHGVIWGGPDNARFSNDLSLCPRPWARGNRIDARRRKLLELALRLDHRIEQALQFQPSGHTRQFRLPQLWAGFSQSDAANLSGEGPEFEETCCWYSLSAATTFERFRRFQDGMTLFPLEWVSGQLDDAAEVLADLAGLPRRQAFPLGEYPGDLIGHQGGRRMTFSVVGRCFATASEGTAPSNQSASRDGTRS